MTHLEILPMPKGRGFPGSLLGFSGSSIPFIDGHLPRLTSGPPGCILFHKSKTLDVVRRQNVPVMGRMTNGTGLYSDVRRNRAGNQAQIVQCSEYVFRFRRLFLHKEA